MGSWTTLGLKVDKVKVKDDAHMSQRVFAVFKCWSFCGSRTRQAPFLMCLCVLTDFLQRRLWSKGFRERNKRTHTCIRTYFTPAWLSVNKVSSYPLRGKWQHDKRVEAWRQGEERGGRWGWREHWEGLKMEPRNTKAVPTYQGGFSFSKCEAWMNNTRRSSGII